MFDHETLFLSSNLLALKHVSWKESLENGAGDWSKRIRKGEVSRRVKQREFQAVARTFGTGGNGTEVHSP